MIFALIASASQALNIIIDKFLLSILKMKVANMVPILFLFLFLITLIFVPFFGFIDLNAFLHFKQVLFFSIMIFLALSWNLLYYQAIKEEQVQEFELFLMLSPLIATFLAALIFPAERNIHIFAASVVASLALIAAHFRKNHLFLSKNHFRIFLCVFLMSLEVIFNKLVLEFVSPVFLYFIRCLLLFILLTIIYKPEFKQIKTKAGFFLFINAIFAVAQMVLKYYGFQKIGIVTTNLILTLSPVLIYLSSLLIFKEKLRKRIIFSSAIILICIVYAILYA